MCNINTQSPLEQDRQLPGAESATGAAGGTGTGNGTGDHKLPVAADIQEILKDQEHRRQSTTLEPATENVGKTGPLRRSSSDHLLYQMLPGNGM